MRSEDQEIAPQAVERIKKAKLARFYAIQRLVGSTLIGACALVFGFVKDQPLVGFGAAFLAWGVLSVSDFQTLRNGKSQ